MAAGVQLHDALQSAIQVPRRPGVEQAQQQVGKQQDLVQELLQVSYLLINQAA